MDLFNTYLPEKIQIFVLLIETKSIGWIWSFGENYMRSGRQISNCQEEVHKSVKLG